MLINQHDNDYKLFVCNGNACWPGSKLELNIVICRIMDTVIRAGEFPKVADEAAIVDEAPKR